MSPQTNSAVHFSGQRRPINSCIESAVEGGGQDYPGYNYYRTLLTAYYSYGIPIYFQYVNVLILSITAIYSRPQTFGNCFILLSVCTAATLRRRLQLLFHSSLSLIVLVNGGAHSEQCYGQQCRFDSYKEMFDICFR